MSCQKLPQVTACAQFLNIVECASFTVPCHAKEGDNIGVMEASKDAKFAVEFLPVVAGYLCINGLRGNRGSSVDTTINLMTSKR